MEDIISVVIPIYKVEDYLANCVNSILNQTYKNMEIILVDDGSPDKCGEMCEEFAKRDTRIRVIHKKNGGLSDARNAGILDARGKYITFIDSDDYISCDFIEYLYNLLKMTSADISTCGYIKTDKLDYQRTNEDSIVYEFTAIEAIQEMLYANIISTSAWGKLYRRDFFDDVKYPIGKYSEDMFTTYKTFLQSNKITYGSRICYMYVKRTGSILSSGFSQKHLDLLEGLDYIETDVVSKYPEVLPAFSCQSVSAVGEILELLPPKNIIIESHMWDRMKKYRKYAIKDKRVGKRTKFIALMSYLGPQLEALLLKSYYSIKWT